MLDNNENEYMAMLLNNLDLIDLISIKPFYLIDDRNKLLLEQILELKKKNILITHLNLQEQFKEKFNIDWFVELWTNSIYSEKKDKIIDRFKDSEEKILKTYKNLVINNIYQELQSQTITYDQYMEKMLKINEIQISKNIKPIDINELNNNLEDKQKILFKNYEMLSEHLNMVQGDFLIVGATTGTGKSGFLLNLMNDLMNDYQCIYFNMEMAKTTIYRRMISINADVPVRTVIDPLTEYDNKLVEQAKLRIQNANIIVEHQASDINDIRNIVAKLKSEKHKVLFIDHLGLTKASGTKGLYEQMTEVAKEIRQICLKYDCTVIGASQLNRTAYSSEQVSLSMLKDSGELENSASKVILLHRPKDQSSLKVNMEIEIAKNRDGRLGIINFEYDKIKQTFTEVENERQGI